MVCAVSGHTAHFVEYELSLAKGLQLQALWLEMQGNETEPLLPANAGTGSFEAVAGLSFTRTFYN